MFYNVLYTSRAQEDLEEWKRQDKRVLKRICMLIANMRETPYSGIGKPEALRFEWSGCYSRRIDVKHRLVYKVNEDERVIYVLQMRDHY